MNCQKIPGHGPYMFISEWWYINDQVIKIFILIVEKKMITLIFTLGVKCLKKGLYRFGVVFTVPWGFSQFLDTQGIHRHWGSYTDKAHCNIHVLCHMGDSLLTILILGGPLGAEIVLFSIIPYKGQRNWLMCIMLK